MNVSHTVRTRRMQIIIKSNTRLMTTAPVHQNSAASDNSDAHRDLSEWKRERLGGKGEKETTKI